MFVRASQDRVLFPATHWFEWVVPIRREKGAGAPAPVREEPSVRPSKVPYVIRRKDRDYMAFAGVRDVWVDPDTGDEIVCGAIVTRSAYGWMTGVHSRMPLVLTLDAEQHWLDASAPIKDLRAEVLKLDVLSDLTAFPVAPITNPSADDPEMLTAVGPAIYRDLRSQCGSATVANAHLRKKRGSEQSERRGKTRVVPR